jgi:hydroxymethylbilane synthase
MPGCPVSPIRGNVLTRLKKLDEGGEYASLVLAAAGLRRLGLDARVSRIFKPEEMIPAAGQGIIACQGLRPQGLGPWTRYKNQGLIEFLNDRDAWDCAKAERAFIERLDSGCALPVAAYAEVTGTELRLMGLYANEERDIYRTGNISGDRKNAAKLGEALAERLMLNA